MPKYILKRLTMFVLVLVSVSILSFLLIGLFGDDPAEIVARRGNFNASHAEIEAVRERLGLNDPMPLRYFAWIGGLLAGDVGMSFYTYNPIMQDVARFFPVSISVVLLAMLWVVLLAVPISLICARHKNGLVDHITRGVTILGICFPTFWLGFLLLIQFAVKWKLFTVVPEPGLKGVLLPSVALAVPIICAVIRLFRSTLLTELSSDYVCYARARGLSQTQILTGHVLRNALPPIVTVFCQYLGYLIAGTAVVESVFSLKGIGSYLVSSVLAADSTAVATVVVIVAALFVLSNLIGDLVNRLLCPWMVKEYNA